MTNPAPTPAGFLAFVRATGITPTVLPDDSVWLDYAYQVALAVVNLVLCQVPGPIYMLSVYNLGVSNLLNFAQDLPDSAPIAGSEPPLPFFAYSRQKYQINSFVSGVIQSAGDEGTNESMVVPKPAEDFTLADLQYLKDPYGRQYLQFAQRYGTQWGLTI